MNKAPSTPNTFSQAGSSEFDWGSYLEKENSLAVPVSCFRHVSLDEVFSTGLRVYVWRGLLIFVFFPLLTLY